MTVVVEIRAAEGGDDAKLLVREQFAVYVHAAQVSGGVSVTLAEERPGFVAFEAVGARADLLFAGEAGGHRWQRVPPNERRGRRHTSTVTVAVLPVTARAQADLDDADLDWVATRGSGPGGQHRNKTASAVQMTHRPTGIAVRIENERSQTQNREIARRVIAARVAAADHAAAAAVTAADRRQQVGTGMRGDKIRTVRVQDGRVIDHRTGKRTTWARYSAGHIEDIQ